jgi:hypothetical protein
VAEKANADCRSFRRKNLLLGDFCRRVFMKILQLNFAVIAT